MTIPAEIRAKIFGLLLVPHEPIHVGDQSMLSWSNPKYTPGKAEAERCGATHGEMTYSFLVCHQLHNELVRLFYLENTFLFDSCVNFHNFLKGIGPERRKFIRSVIIFDDHTYHTKKQSQQAKGFKLLGDSQHLHRLELQLEEYNRSEKLGKWDTERQQEVKLPLLRGKIMESAADDRIGMLAYDGHLDMTNFEGLKMLKGLRGLSDVVLKERRTGEELRRENTSSASELVALLKRPKIVDEGEKVDDTKALQMIKFDKRLGKEVAVKPKEVEKRHHTLRGSKKAVEKRKAEMQAIKEKQEAIFLEHDGVARRRAARLKGDDIVEIDGKETYIDNFPEVLTPRKAKLLEQNGAKRVVLGEITSPNSKRKKRQLTIEEWMNMQDEQEKEALNEEQEQQGEREDEDEEFEETESDREFRERYEKRSRMSQFW